MCTYPSLYSSDECVGKPAPPVTVWLDGIYFWTRSFSLLFPGDPAVLTWFLVFTFSVCVSYVDANPFTAVYIFLLSRFLELKIRDGVA